MNKILKTTGIVAVLVAALALVLVTGVFAQEPVTPDGPVGGGQLQRGNGAGTGLGVMAVDESDMHAAIAGALGMSLEDFESSIANGKTPAILAQELGVDFADVWAAMEAVHAEALLSAVDDGLIPQEQADWILSHRGGQNGQGNGPQSNGMGNSSGTRMGRGPGGNAGNGGNGGDCIYQTQ